MTTPNSDDIALQTVGGSVYSVGASAVTLTLGFVRAVIMARLLLPEHFGVTTLALFYLNLASQLRALGIDNALIHRKDPDDDVLATYFTMRVGQVAISVFALVALIPLLGRLHSNVPLLPPILLAYVGIGMVKGLNGVQTTILSKRMAFRQLAITDVIGSITMTVVGPGLAWLGFGVWSIVAELASGMLSRAIAVWLIYRAWRPRLGWNGQIARWFWNYGSKIWVGTNVTFLLDRFDDWWVGTYLGADPLGFYSRAYEFARYPRKAIANPVLSVFYPAFAQLQDDRQRLSRAFFRPTSLMVRAGALFSLILILIAPEFIQLLLGERWLPMVFTFQLMIVYTLLDPLLVAASNLLAATGYPGKIAKTRVIQALIFIPAVVILGPRLGIEGVALAADLMVFVGAVLLFWHTREVVNYSQRTLWFWPSVGVLFTSALTLASAPLLDGYALWIALVAKLVFISVIYLGLLWLTERRQLLTGWRMIWGLIRSLPRALS